MSTHFRRALPSVIVAGGIVLTAVLPDGAGRVVPGALLLVVTGGAAALYLHLDRPRRPRSRVVRLVTDQARPTVVGRANAPHCAIPTPRSAPEGGASTGRPVPVDRWVAARPGDPARGAIRHCVLPRGGLPHQRRASDGS